MHQSVIVFICIVLSGYSSRAEWKELVLKVKPIDEWRVYRINNQLKCIDGVRLCGYHQATNTLLIKYDDQKLLDTKIVNVVVYRLNNKLKTTTVKNLSIFDVLDGKLK